MPEPIPKISLTENLLYNAAYVVPNYLQGLFRRNRFWVRFWGAVHPDPAGVWFVSRLRRKYRSSWLFLRLLTTRTLLILDPQGIRRVLDRSPDVYAEPRAKRQGMSHFQPGAVTISRGAPWTQRRRFNEQVLQTPDRLHADSREFLGAIRFEVDAAVLQWGRRVGWREFEDLFARLALHLLFGRDARNDLPMVRQLSKMMRQSNRVFALGRSRHFRPFSERMRYWLRNAPAGSLAARCRQAAFTPDTRVESQVTHWMFAIKDTLAENVVRALALVAAHPDAERRIRQEIAAADLGDPAAIDRLRFLEACIHEAMRLWPTTPMLIRETVSADVLGGSVVPAGTQVLILNSFNHRDREMLPDADRLAPERWLRERAGEPFNHLSSGPQGCAGRHLALFAAKSVIALLLRDATFTVERPRFGGGRLPYAVDAFRIVLDRREPPRKREMPSADAVAGSQGRLLQPAP